MIINYLLNTYFILLFQAILIVVNYYLLTFLDSLFDKNLPQYFIPYFKFD